MIANLLFSTNQDDQRLKLLQLWRRDKEMFSEKYILVLLLKILDD